MKRVRIGVITKYLYGNDSDELRYSILKLNTLQRFAEFEIIYDFPRTSGLRGFLKERGMAERKSVEYLVEQATNELDKWRAKKHPGAIKEFFECNRYVLITSMSLSDRHFLIDTNSKARVLAVGDWNSKMAPPSLLEFIVHNCLKQALFEIAPTSNSHNSSVGCIFDFNLRLVNTKNGILNGYLCEECRNSLGLSQEIVEDISSVFGGKWLGDRNDIHSAHSELQRFGYRPYQTSGVRVAFLEKVIERSSNKFTDELVKYAVLFFIFYLAVKLGLSDVQGLL